MAYDKDQPKRVLNNLFSFFFLCTDLKDGKKPMMILTWTLGYKPETNEFISVKYGKKAIFKSSDLDYNPSFNLKIVRIGPTSSFLIYDKVEKWDNERIIYPKVI